MFYSIITVTYNHLNGLKRTAESLRVQTCRDYQWIIVDGGSDDGTNDYLTSLNALIISEPDQGIYDAMNKGISTARGEYILFLNAGDCLANPHVLEKVRSCIKPSEMSIDFVYGDAYEQDKNNHRHFKPARSKHAYKWGMITHHQAMFYRRASVSALLYDLKYHIAADYKFTCNLIQNAENILYIDTPICSFETGGLSQRETAMARKEQYRIRSELGLTSYIENNLIYWMQSFTLLVRRMCPALYWYLRAGWKKDKK